MVFRWCGAWDLGILSLDKHDQPSVAIRLRFRLFVLDGLLTLRLPNDRFAGSDATGCLPHRNGR